jgi:hypothetical protein
VVLDRYVERRILSASHERVRSSILLLVERGNAARGGRAKASGELGRVKARLYTLADMVERGQMDRADAAVISQIWGTYLRTVSVELKAGEQVELTERLEALEEALEQRKEERRYGA